MPRFLVFPRDQLLAELTREAARKADQTGSMLGQILLADARLAVEAVQRSLRSDSYQIPVSLFVLCQHEQMIVIIALRVGAMVFLLADVELTAQDRLDAALLRRLKKMHRAINVAMVGNRDRLL